MKRLLAAVLSLVLATPMLAGCASNLPKGYSPFASAPEAVPEQRPETPPSGKGLATGLAILNSVAKSKDAGEEDGLAEADTNIVAVLVDAQGRIVDCKIDAVQAKIPFSKEGKLLADTAAMFRTKQELGGEYGMKKASGIGKEWYEQANALAAYVTGKTVEEIKGIALTETTAPADAELAATVTISIGDWIASIEKAVANAKPLGAKAGDKLGIGTVTNMSKSKDAGAEDGLAQVDSIYAAASFGTDGRVTSCILDGSQSSVRFDKTGKITTGLDIAPQTKNGMKQASGIGLEWYQQAENYARYALGKTADELSGIAVNDSGSPQDAELAASVTISVGDFNLALGKAADSAR